MQSSLKLSRLKGDRLFAKRKINFTGGLTAVVVLLPQALAFAAASEVEPKAELYIAVVVGTVAAALVISGLGKNFKGGCGMKSPVTRPNNTATLALPSTKLSALADLKAHHTYKISDKT